MGFELDLIRERTQAGPAAARALEDKQAALSYARSVAVIDARCAKGESWIEPAVPPLPEEGEVVVHQVRAAMGGGEP